MPVKLQRIRTVSAGPLFPLMVARPHDVLYQYQDLYHAHPGFLRRDTVIDREARTYALVLVMDTVAHAKALHALLSDMSVPEVKAYEETIAATAVGVGTVYEVSWRLTAS